MSIITYVLVGMYAVLNRADRHGTMERKWFSNTNIFICHCIPCHASNIIYTE